MKKGVREECRGRGREREIEEGGGNYLLFASIMNPKLGLRGN